MRSLWQASIAFTLRSGRKRTRPVETAILDHIVPRQVTGERNVSRLHSSQCRTRGGGD